MTQPVLLVQVKDPAMGPRPRCSGITMSVGNDGRSRKRSYGSPVQLFLGVLAKNAPRTRSTVVLWQAGH